MSSIPPAGHAGLIQAHGAQRTAGEEKAREAQKQAGKTQTDPFAERLKEAINNDELDSQVFADGEGNGGGQGRASEHPHDHEEPDEPAPDDDASNDGEGGIDLQA